MYNTLQRIRRRFSTLPSTMLETNDEKKIFVPLPQKRVGLDLDMTRTDKESVCTIDASIDNFPISHKTIVQPQQ